jgi:hypothetical protein
MNIPLITMQNIGSLILIFLTIVVLSKVIDITFNIFVWMIIGSVVIWILYYSKNKLVPPEIEKMKTISRFTGSKKLDNYPDMISFLYDVRYYNCLNPVAFNEMISSIETFFQLYDEIMYYDMLYCVQNIEVAVDYGRLALNNFQSMIYGLSADKLSTKKFHSELSRLEIILNKYINDMTKKCGANFNNDPKAFNYASMNSPSPWNNQATPALTILGNNQSTTFSYY